MDSQYFKDLLHDRGLKVTSPRLALLMSMNDYKSAMPYSEIQKSMDSIDRVTLYRTLESLKKKGILHKAFQEKNEIYYAICGDACLQEKHTHDHIHFKCVKCETVTCEETSSSIEISIPDFQINKTSIYLEGICKFCA